MSKKDVAKKAAKEAATKDTRAKVEKTNLIVVEEVGKAVPDVQEVLMRTLLPPDCALLSYAARGSIYVPSNYALSLIAAMLENYHVAQSFLVMKNADFNVLGQLALDDFKRDMIIRATDMAKQKLVHFLQFNRVRKFVY
ncbi:unnamed protein product [Peronospora belbahrii]|uniref:Uncharacterized protein n=1 Tax=Peronospora belbahrii TaxID=622444 RepID=A0ABN8CXC9_9STRA|nr:unnamed protein product [Peronospora belbahrii]